MRAAKDLDRQPMKTAGRNVPSTLNERRRRVFSLADLLALDARVRPSPFEIMAGRRADIPAIVRLLRTRRMPSGLPLKFARSEQLLADTWPQVHWLLAKRRGTLVGCLELRPVPDDTGIWEMGSFSQAAHNANPWVPVRLMAAGFRKLVELGARAAVVEVHARNDAMWRFLAHLPFEPEAQSAAFPEFTRCRMALDGRP